MKKWLKVQLTEVSAWAGFLLMFSHAIPETLLVALGVLLISIDDDKAKAWCLKIAPWLSEKVDRA